MITWQTAAAAIFILVFGLGPAAYVLFKDRRKS